jgi:hypothetical protein
MPEYDMTLDGTTIWMDTGLTLDGTGTVTIRAQGQWTANPANGLVDANGHPGLVAKPGYSLPGELEGLLVGKVGDNVFPIGADGAVPATLAGELFISINDDVNAQYGAGFPDNQGSLQIRITVT